MSCSYKPPNRVNRINWHIIVIIFDFLIYGFYDLTVKNKDEKNYDIEEFKT